MEAKKNENHKIEKNSILYFSVGLVAVLLLAYLALEWKTYSVSEWDTTAQLNLQDELTEEAPITFHKLPPPPPKIQTPPVIEIIPDDPDIDDSPIASTETNYTTEIIPIDDIQVAEDDTPDEVSFIVIEDVPIFPGCEDADDKRVCFQEMMQKHIRKNFRYPEAAQEMGLQGRVNLVFTIQKDGSISEVKMRGPHKVLETEAARIISKLPKMTPGKQRGTPVKVPFAIPITFKLQ
ncbi:energy transducer TonB [Flagellimonas sp. HMM57]|nr:energy transducer TonB [Flagellimonas sp. HMM57]UII77947.1 energy transducer TonB [Flagellimonas sp. HMM57]